jgi:L-ascorbate metabolism protein UlaG (beta-lactamase superfamily)
MKITFYAHASFRLETLAVSVVTDPYTPEGKGRLRASLLPPAHLCP